MTARPLFLGRRLAASDFLGTDGHTEPRATQPTAAHQLDSTEGYARIDSGHLSRHRAETPDEAAAAEQRRRANVERLADDAISRRQLLIWAVVFISAIVASHFFPGAWGYGWQP